MSTKRDRLIEEISELVEAAGVLRVRVQGFERTMTKIARRLEAGDPAVPTVRGIAAPTLRQDLTQAIEDFETARHRLRLALFALGKEEGASISEIGRVLGISRQLASRLAGEADGEI